MDASNPATYEDRVSDLLKQLHAAAVAGDREAGEFLAGCFWPWAARQLNAPSASAPS